MTKTNKSKSDEAYETLRNHIISGALSPGERLTETNVASKLGLGRMPVRESLWRLEAEGFVKGRVGRRGKFVEYLEDENPEDVLHRYELREAIEPMALWLASKNMNGWQIEQFVKLTNHLVESAQKDCPQDRRKARNAWDRFLYEHCGNPLLLKAYEVFHISPSQPRSARVEHEILTQIPEEIRRKVSVESILAAVASHNADEAERLDRENIRLITAAIRNVVLRPDWKDVMTDENHS